MYHLPILASDSFSLASASSRETPPLIITPSGLGCLCSCAHRHLLRYELGYRAPHGIAEDFGTLNHCLLKLLHRSWEQNKKLLAIDEQVYQWIRPLAYEHARLRFAPEPIRETLIESACRIVTKYVQAERSNLRFVLEAEAPFRFYFTEENLTLDGRIDAVVQYPNENYTLRDFKSRKIHSDAEDNADAGVVTHDTLAVCALAWEKQHNSG